MPKLEVTAVNYGEELAYWYLRLNGFFPISRYVIHRAEEGRDPSDCDVLGVRFPHVYEPVGGKPGDWDPWLEKNFGFNCHVGVICEVKTGRYAPRDLFRPQHLDCLIGRLGFVPSDRIEQVVAIWRQPVVQVTPNHLMVKLLVAAQGRSTDAYLFRSLDRVLKFVCRRIRKYPNDKFWDRIYFDSALLQFVIDRVRRKEVRRRQRIRKG